MTNEKTNELLEEILKWQKLQGMTTMRELIPQLLSDEKRRLVYDLTDGKNTQPEIAKKTGVAGGSISNWWNEWYAKGIVSKEKRSYRKIISLKELGISIKDKKE